MEMASEKLAARYSFLYFSVSGPGPVASLRDSHASSDVSPARFVLHLLPDQIGERLRYAGLLHHGVAHVDVELKGHGELVVHQAGGNEYALRVAQIEIAMADRVVAQRHVIAVGDHGFVALVHG